MKTKKTTVLSIIFAIILTLTAGLILFSSCSENEPDGEEQVMGIISAEAIDRTEENAVIADIPNYDEVYADKVITKVPRFIEKSAFENFMEMIPEDSRGVYIEMYAYYSLNDISDPALSDESKSDLIELFPFLSRDAFYIFDPNANYQKIAEIIGYWNEYIGWSDEAYIAV